MTKRVIETTLSNIIFKSMKISFQACKIYEAINEGEGLSKASIKELKTEIGLLMILKEELP